MTKTKEQLRDQILNCRVCHIKHPKHSKMLHGTSRYGTGSTEHHTKLMIVGQNPPFDLERRLHGAWMLHYKNREKGSHEKLVEELVYFLGLTPPEVYATQTVKCASLSNEVPHDELANTCVSWHLRYEVEAIYPLSILAFGNLASLHTRGIALHPDYPWTRPWDKLHGSYKQYRIYTFKHVISAPHPSTVGRFVDREWWMHTIREAYQYVVLP